MIALPLLAVSFPRSAVRGSDLNPNTRSEFPACPLGRYAWGVCRCSTPEPADYVSADVMDGERMGKG